MRCEGGTLPGKVCQDFRQRQSQLTLCLKEIMQLLLFIYDCIGLWALAKKAICSKLSREDLTLTKMFASSFFGTYPNGRLMKIHHQPEF